jgi:hypothetical protein
MAAPKPERRAGRRVPWNLPVSLRYGSSRERTLATTRDVSERGAFFFCKDKITVGSDLELIFVMPPEVEGFARQWVCCHAKVVRVEPERTRYGIAAVIKRCEAMPVI